MTDPALTPAEQYAETQAKEYWETVRTHAGGSDKARELFCTLLRSAYLSGQNALYEKINAREEAA